MSRRLPLLVALSALVCPMPGGAQVPDKFDNLEVLPADISKRELVSVMREFAGALGVRCNHCHVGPDNLLEMDFATDEKPEKVLARKMMRMVDQINAGTLAKMEFADARQVDVECITCHRGVTIPMRIEQVLFRAIAARGVDEAIQQYLALKGRYFGRSAYDFGVPPLTAVADQLARGGDLDDALAVAAFAVGQFPDQAWPNMVLANLHVQRGDREKAIAGFRRVLELEPGNLQARGALERLKAGQP